MNKLKNLSSTPPHPLIARFLRTLCCALWIAWSAHAAEPVATQAEAKRDAPALPVAVPVAELSAQAEAASVNLREIVTDSTASTLLPRIDRELPALVREIDIRARENARIVAQKPSLDLLRTLERNWQRIRRTLGLWSDGLDARISALDRDLARIGDLERTWQETRKAALKEDAPAELLARVDALLESIGRARDAVEKQRAYALRLQSRVAAQDFRISESVEAIRQVRDASLARLFERDSAPVWNRELLSRAGNQIATDSQDTREAQWVALKNYAARNWDRFVWHSIVFVALAIFLYWIRRRIDARARTEPGLQRPALAFAWPIATALLLSFIASRWIYPEAPRLLWAFVGASALIPTVLVLRRLVAPYLLPLLYAVLAFFLTDQVRAITASIELVGRAVFLFEMLAGAAFLAWFMMRLKRNGDAIAPTRGRKVVNVGVRAACALFVLTAFANAIGYVALANLLGTAALRSMYLGLILYALVEILDALVIMAMRVRPLRLLGMVGRHRELLRKRVRFVLNGIAIVLWTLFTLERLAIRERVLRASHRALTAELSVGSISVSAADVLAFVLAVWASFLVSRFVRFVLDEEVFPHAHLKRGLPYAISQTVHYLILVAGFFFAMAALGLDMTKFTILAGAFTVGVGFGLQNIFNNFVSGLILLYERPVQVGDVVQMDDAAGVVERIGIRASIVRTPNGSEIIVPNGKLISERLVNWTFSDRQRGIEVPVSVVLGSDPKRVIEILERIASEHPKLLKSPPPQALLTRVGPDWMGFELHASTNEVEDWMEVRSDVAVAMTAALVHEKVALR